MRRSVWQPHSPGIGTPIFAKPHNVRQRMAVRKMLCGHCGLPTERGKRFWFARGHYAEGYYMTVDTPLHKECAEISARACPVLRRDGDRMRPWPESNSMIFYQIVGGPKVLDDFALNISPDNPVVGHLKFGWPEKLVRIDACPTT